jgi:adenylate kinase
LTEAIKSSGGVPQKADSLVLIGPPGSGKGTQAARLAARCGFDHINTGAILRQEIAAGSSLGQRVEPYVRAGELIPTELLSGVMAARLRSASHAFLLDGYPRNLAQASALDQTLEELRQTIAGVIALELDDQTAAQRLEGRLVCAAEGHTYHRSLCPPSAEGVCDIDGSQLVARQDDRDLGALRSRLELFRAQTVPVIERYCESGLLMRVEATGSPERVAERLEYTLGASLSRNQPRARISRGSDRGKPGARAQSGTRRWAA